MNWIVSVLFVVNLLISSLICPSYLYQQQSYVSKFQHPIITLSCTPAHFFTHHFYSQFPLFGKIPPEHQFCNYKKVPINLVSIEMQCCVNQTTLYYTIGISGAWCDKVFLGSGIRLTSVATLQLQTDLLYRRHQISRNPARSDIHDLEVLNTTTTSLTPPCMMSHHVDSVDTCAWQ